MVAKNASIGSSPQSVSVPPRTPDSRQGNVSATQALPVTERRVKDMSNDELTTYLKGYGISPEFIGKVKQANLTGSAFSRMIGTQPTIELAEAVLNRIAKVPQLTAAAIWDDIATQLDRDPINMSPNPTYDPHSRSSTPWSSRTAGGYNIKYPPRWDRETPNGAQTSPDQEARDRDLPAENPEIEYEDFLQDQLVF